MRSPALTELFDAERDRLRLLAGADSPAGEYACPVFSTGSETARVMLIGEAPGAEETKAGEPFVGKAGRQLTELLGIMRLTRDELYLTNAVKYRPVVRGERSIRNRTPDRSEVQASLPLLEKEILFVRPILIATLGNTPLKAVLMLAGAKEQTVGALHGQALPLKIGSVSMELFPLYHPASGIYNPKLIKVMEADALKFGEHLVKQA